jgi:hypothetical protein
VKEEEFYDCESKRESAENKTECARERRKEKKKNHLTDEVNGREFKFIWKLLFYCYVSGIVIWHHLNLLF